MCVSFNFHYHISCIHKIRQVSTYLLVCPCNIISSFLDIRYFFKENLEYMLYCVQPLIWTKLLVIYYVPLSHASSFFSHADYPGVISSKIDVIFPPQVRAKQYTLHLGTKGVVYFIQYTLLFLKILAQLHVCYRFFPHGTR
jgi:hypothetical protein